MSWVTYAVRRTAFAALSALLVVSVTFLVIRTAPNTDLGALIASMQRGGASPAEIDAAVRQYKAARGLSGSLLDQYVRFVLDVAVLDLGYSTELQRPVAAVLGESVPRTLGYVVPGVAMAYVVGVVAGLASAYGGRAVDWSLRLTTYVGLGVTTIVLGVALVTFFPYDVEGLSDPIWHGTPFMSMGRPSFWGADPWRRVCPKYVLPAGVLAVGMVSGLYRHTRNNALQYRGSSMSKMLDAKGADRVMGARHALRNAALPLLSVSFAELMSVLALGAFVVESIFRIPGIAAYTMIGVYTRDYQLVVGAAFVFALVGIVGSLVQDLLYGYLDPTVSED